jgi:hypothetical protein
MAEDSSPSLDSLIGDRARDDHGRFVSVTPTEAPKEPPKVEAKAPPKVDATPAVITPVDATPAVVTPPVVTPPIDTEKEGLKKAMQAERERRQALQAELEALKKPPAPPVDPWTDLPGALAQQQQTFQEQLRQQRLMVSEDLAREKYKDFEEVITHFNEAVQKNPALADQMLNARNPAEYAYKQGLLHKELGSVNGDPVAYRAKLEADIRASVQAEFNAKHGIAPVEVPTSLNADSSPAVKEPVYAGPPPLKSLLRINDRRS